MLNSNNLNSKNLSPNTFTKIALITGASRGIGFAIMHKLSVCYSDILIIVTATSQLGIDKINEHIIKHNLSNILPIILDLSDSNQITEFVTQINTQYGGIDILINNAGITQDNLFLRMKETEWDNVIDINLKANFLLTKAIIKSMLAKRYGRIVNISSVVAFTGNAGQVNYTAAKAAIVAFSKSLAQELGGRNITVNCVAPGFIETDMTSKLKPEVKDSYIKQIPLARFGHADDIANAVKFLISDEASYITGTTIHVNGGLYCS